jgi:hypothetical protein
MPLRSTENKGRETKREVSASFCADGFTVLIENINTVTIRVKDVFCGSKTIGLKVSLEKIK